MEQIGGTDGGDNIDLEDGSSSCWTIIPTISNLSGGTDDYAVTAGELEIAYDRFEDTESLDVNLILGGKVVVLVIHNQLKIPM